MGHGGARPGAGRPVGGISQLRRVLCNAIRDGLEHAGREKGLEGDADVVAREAAARIVSDMILAGQGAEVLKLGAVIAPKSGDEGGGEEGDSPVLAALRRMPGMLDVPESSRKPVTVEGSATESAPCDPGTSDYQSDGAAEGELEDRSSERGRPFFAPQMPLLPAEPAGAEPALPAGPGGGGARAPHPPAGGTPVPTGGNTGRLENSETRDEEAAA